MKHPLIAAALAAALVTPCAAHAGDWTGTGEFGLAFARGNAESSTINARFNFKQDADPWLYDFTAGGLRAKGEIITVNPNTGAIRRDSVTNANRFDLGGKVGRRIDDRLYLYGSGRYDRDDFAAFRWQFSSTVGLGYEFIKEERTTLTSEFGLGWRRFQPVDLLVIEPPPPRLVRPDSEDSMIARLGVDFSHTLTETTDVVNKLVVESGDGKTFAQNDLGVSVKINERFALRTGFQLRHNSDAPPGVASTDRLLTTNIVVGF
jgi:putative salt-induced outer membrane protein